MYLDRMLYRSAFCLIALRWRGIDASAPQSKRRRLWAWQRTPEAV